MTLNEKTTELSCPGAARARTESASKSASNANSTWFVLGSVCTLAAITIIFGRAA